MRECEQGVSNRCVVTSSAENCHISCYRVIDGGKGLNSKLIFCFSDSTGLFLVDFKKVRFLN